MKEQFIKFLKKHGALRKFKYNLRHVARHDDKDIDSFCKGNSETIYILSAFRWAVTREGLDYWHDLDKVWIKEVKRTK